MYNELQQRYQFLAEQFLIKKFGLKWLDERFSEINPEYIPTELKSRNGLKYIYLLNEAHLERLNVEESFQLEHIYEVSEKEHDLKYFLESTYQKVLYSCLTPNTTYEYFKDIRGKGILPGRAIVFIFTDTYLHGVDEYTMRTVESEKTKIFNCINHQYMNLLKNKFPDEEIFLIRRKCMKRTE